MVAFLTPLANDGIGYNFGFVFAGCNIAIAIIVWFFLYETVGLSLENVDQMYSQPELKPWFLPDTLPENREIPSRSVMRLRGSGVMSLGMGNPVSRLSRRGSIGREVILQSPLLLLAMPSNLSK
jgi:hypothetical protein